ncbi:MAG: MBOAT family O-acyltransferase [Lachnospiraceae bacterium]
MDFLTITFGIFFLISAVGYYIIPKKARWVWLLCSGLVFYTWAVPQMILYLLFSALTSWLFGRYAGKRPGQGKGLLWLVIALNTGVLLFVKFYPWAGAKLHLPALNILVPMGISFYTLQIIAYCVDVYRGRVQAQENFFRYLLFVSFFPQILQGPIPRYEKLGRQLYEGHAFDYRGVKFGLQLMLWGFFLKMVIADRAAIFVNTVFPEYQFYSGTIIAVAAVLYSIQLYTDFLGCVCIAMGAAQVYGIHLETNFCRPYFAVSIKDFWRRWHISLSSWLRDYVYIPLGGSRRGTVRKYVNLIITFLVSGIWHGVGLKYLAWGLMQGGYQIAGELLMPVRKKVLKLLKIAEDSRLHREIQRVITFLLVTAGWIMFRANGVRAGLDMMRRILTDITPWVFWNGEIYNCGIEARRMTALILAILLVLIVEWMQEKGSIRERLEQQHIFVRWAVYLGAVALVLVLGVYGPGYSSAQFLYGQF